LEALFDAIPVHEYADFSALFPLIQGTLNDERDAEPNFATSFITFQRKQGLNADFIMRDGTTYIELTLPLSAGALSARSESSPFMDALALRVLSPLDELR
jgi:hypothetical protein